MNNQNHVQALYQVAHLNTETADGYSNSTLSTDLESDGWSQRVTSSKANIDEGDIAHSEDDARDARYNWISYWILKLWGNCILSGCFGIESKRVVRKLCHKHPISKQLVTNVDTYNSIIRNSIRNELLPEIKTLATQMYFPTGQVEADGLSATSAEIWTATYLLLSIHKKMREADFLNTRVAYCSLVWDSAQAYRATLQFYKTFHEFRNIVFPLWQKIETLVGINEKLAPGTGKPSSRTKKAAESIPPLLAGLTVCDELLMQNSLKLLLIPEIASSCKTPHGKSVERAFADLEYGEQIEIIQALLIKPSDTILGGSSVLRRLESLLRSNLSQKQQVGYSSNSQETHVSCIRALRILMETLKLLHAEVNLTASLRLSITESIRTTARHVHEMIGYSEWVISKFSEFHSMLRLCYNFALLCFDLDLPSFDKIEKLSVEIKKSGMEDENDLLELKMASLSKLMMEATTSFASSQKHGSIDEDYDWADFYKTDYPWVLQRLPLRFGLNLLQFTAQPGSKLAIRQRIGTANPNMSIEESLTNIPRRLWTVYRKDTQQALACSVGESVQLV